MLIFINGKFYPEQDAKVSVLDHGLLYADGIFETLRTYNGKIFKISEHVERLFYSAEKIGLKIPLRKKEIESALISSVEGNNLNEAYIRITVTRGTGDIGYTSKCVPNVIVIAKKFHQYPRVIYEKGVSAVTYTAERFLPEVKSINCLALVLAKNYAQRKKSFDALLVDRDGFVTEGTVTNVFFVKNNVVYTPEENILRGITRDIVISIAKKEFSIREQEISKKEIFNFDECFATNTSAELVPVVVVDGKKIGDGKPGKVWKTLTEKFKQEVKGYYAERDKD